MQRKKGKQRRYRGNIKEIQRINKDNTKEIQRGIQRKIHWKYKGTRGNIEDIQRNYKGNTKGNKGKWRQYRGNK